MKVWPFGVAGRTEASNHHMPRWLKTVVVSDVEKAPRKASGGDQEGERKRIAEDVSKTYSDGIRTGGVDMAPGKVRRIPVYWPGGARHGGDASLICCFRAERGKAGPDSCAQQGWREGVPQAAELDRCFRVDCDLNQCAGLICTWCRPLLSPVFLTAAMPLRAAVGSRVGGTPIACDVSVASALDPTAATGTIGRRGRRPHVLPALGHV